MRNDFTLAPLGNYATVQIGFSFKSQDFGASGVPVLKIKNIKLREVDISELDCVSEQIANQTTRYYAQRGDLLISMTGSGPQAPKSVVGRVARFAGPDNTYLINQRVGRFVIKEPDKLDSRYLFYVLTQPDYQWRLVSIATGSANQANISIGQIESLVIPVPSSFNQRAIAHVLGTLDDKIELNRLMNETLEAMARALFKSWFVDFDPVRAKAEGRRPAGMDAETAALFPDSFEDSPLGEVPRGWKVTVLGELIEFAKGRKPIEVTTKLRKGYLPVVLIETFDTNRSAYSTPDKMVIAESDDVLMVMDGASSGRVETGHGGIVGSTIAKVSPKQRATSKRILYYALKHIEPEARENVTGTSIPHADRGWVIRQVVCLPTKPALLGTFHTHADVVRRKIQANDLESRTLAAIRDALLPRLLSGETRVKG